MGLKPYSQVVFKQGLKARSAVNNGEGNKFLDWAVEYMGVVGVELVDMLASVNSKVEAIAPCMPTQHMFRGDGL